MMEAMMLKENDLQSLEQRKNFVLTVIGCGRIGLPTACLFSSEGFKVICLDSDSYVVSKINRGVSPFFEPGLSQLLKENLKEKRILATSDPMEAVQKSDIVILAVDTPIDEKNQPNYTTLEESCKNVGLNMKRGTLLIVECTLGPMIMENLVMKTLEASSGLKAGVDFGLAYSPVRASIGKTLRDMREYSRIIAAINRQSLTAAKEVLRTITKGKQIEVPNFRTAEATKLFENIYRDVNISLANELAVFCEAIGIDYYQIQTAANTQPYCHLLKPGIVGGRIRKDPFLLIKEAADMGVRLKMTTLARRVNDEILRHSCNLIKDALRDCDKSVKRSRIAILGVSYRPNVKEARWSRAPELIKILKRMGAKISVYDPAYTHKELRTLGYDAEPTLDRTVEGADCMVIVVGHSRFRRLPLAKLGALMKKPAAIVDLGCVVNPFKAMKKGFIYRGLGRGVVKK